MITRLIGNVDGNETVFSQINEGLWEATVPLDLDGTYVIDLRAVDEAGNESYYATVLFTVDPEKLHVALTFLKYRLEGLKREYNLGAKKSWVFTKSQRGFDLSRQISGYKLERGHQCEL